MDHSIDPERPRKRIKHAHGSLHQHVPQHTGYHYLRPTQHEDPSSAYANVANVATTMTNPNQAPHAWSQPKLYEDSWALPQPSSDSHLVLSFSSDQSAQDDEGWASSTGHETFSSDLKEVAQHPTSTSAPFPPTDYQFSRPLPRLVPDIYGNHEVGGQLYPPTVETRSNFLSPFSDCRGSFGKFTIATFSRPIDGRVNGYVKFNWPTQNRPRSADTTRTPAVYEILDDQAFDDDEDVAETPYQAMLSSSRNSPMPPQATQPLVGPLPPSATGDRNNSKSPYSQWSPSTISGPTSPITPRWASPIGSALIPVSARTENPRLLPSHFGHAAKMEAMDRKLLSFYIKNWCPGRTILAKTNLWEKDFAAMQQSEGVQAAIQSLAGIYVYDYQPTNQILRRVNDRFSVAESRLTDLLNDPTSLEVGKGSEVITISVILSMQDIVLTERRRKKPFFPRWLQGFRQSEYFLDHTDSGARFWNKKDVQLDSLALSQTIIVGRALILAQPMMLLPAPATFDPDKESKRFGWLLYGTKQEMYEIHGGCGFSKKLLHVFSQITYCAARLQQDPESPVIPMTADFLLRELLEMRQWSSVSRSWETAKVQGQVIDWVSSLPQSYVVQSPADMTDVTAEAWRFAAILYLQCRALRLPRNHPEVLTNMCNLEICIRIMPTSGKHFTAQAPLFPVFLLGLLAVVPLHKSTAMSWFDDVVKVPVRSSVPPLYDVLQRIRNWIDIKIPRSDGQLPDNVGARNAWWEELVARVEGQETETLCLT